MIVSHIALGKETDTYVAHIRMTQTFILFLFGYRNIEIKTLYAVKYTIGVGTLG